jgi:hypothetical protein
LAVVARKLMIVGLIVLIIMLALPLGIGMAMGMCPQCTQPYSPHALELCMAVLTAFVLVVSSTFVPLTTARRRRLLWLLADPLERPPRAL